MLRNIIVIDEEKCNGCGLCADACHEGAIGMVNGKAKLLREDYCDGLGDCLPACPVGAITFEEREAAPYDAQAVQAAQAQKQPLGTPHSGGCPGSAAKVLRQTSPSSPSETAPASELRQWPVQIKLAAVNAPWLHNAKVLVAADCSAFAYGDFHRRFIRGRVVLVGCPKLDMIDYTEKLTDIFSQNEIKNVTVVRMEVPCCGGIEQAVKEALRRSGKMIPWQVVTLSLDGAILDEG